jgi:hypothetical protein
MTVLYTNRRSPSAVGPEVAVSGKQALVPRYAAFRACSHRPIHLENRSESGCSLITDYSTLSCQATPDERVGERSSVSLGGRRAFPRNCQGSGANKAPSGNNRQFQQAKQRRGHRSIALRTQRRLGWQRCHPLPGPAKKTGILPCHGAVLLIRMRESGTSSVCPEAAGRRSARRSLA